MIAPVFEMPSSFAWHPAMLAIEMSNFTPVSAQKGILQRIAAGDQAAVRECIDTYGSLIWSLARRYLRNSASAEDAVQDVFIDLWGSAARFDPAIASEAAFVSTIARRRFIDRLRHQTRQPGFDSLDDEETGDIYQPAVAAPMEDESEVAIVERVLNSMEPDHRQILSLSLYEGYTHSEIAEQLDMPLGTVKTRIRRGLIHIREQLQIPPGSADEVTG